MQQAEQVEAGLSETVRKIIAGYLDVPLETILPEKSLLDLGADSLDFIEIMFELEEKFGVETEEEIPELRQKILCIGDVIQLVAGLVAEKAQKAETAKVAGQDLAVDSSPL